MGLRTYYFLDFKTVVTLLVILITYFLYMDVSLYYHIQALSPLQSVASMSSETPSISSSAKKAISRNGTSPKLFSPFKGLSVKTMMLDHSSVYILNVGSVIFNHVSSYFSWVNNM